MIIWLSRVYWYTDGNIFLQELETSKSDGEEKISAVVNLADQTLPQTASNGQQIIKKELDSLKHDWGKFITAIADQHTHLFCKLLQINTMVLKEQAMKRSISAQYSLPNSYRKLQDQTSRIRRGFAKCPTIMGWIWSTLRCSTQMAQGHWGESEGLWTEVHIGWQEKSIREV